MGSNQAKPPESWSDFEGGYQYMGNGDWSRIDSLHQDGETLHGETTSLSYEAVPHQIRERVYDAFDDGVNMVMIDANDNWVFSA